LQAVSSLLTELGIRYKRNTTGANVISQIRTMDPTPDIILLDFSLPQGDACAIASTLRATADLRHIPVIAMLDAESLPCHATVSQLGVVEVLMKPLPRLHLGTILRRAARSSRRPKGKSQTSPLGAG
jgi:PleD family two-component response regulator